MSAAQSARIRKGMIRYVLLVRGRGEWGHQQAVGPANWQWNQHPMPVLLSNLDVRLYIRICPFKKYG